MSDNKFDDFILNNQEQSQKEIPATNSKGSKQTYKSVRIYPEDFEILREAAFRERKTIIEVISETVREKYDK